MNTKHLRKEYASTYETFFTKHKIIFSTPFVLSRSGEADAWYSGVSVKQKIPLRMYIGLTSSKKSGIHFGDITYKDLSNQQFLTTTLQEYAPYMHEIEKFITCDVPTSGDGYTINICSELPRGTGLGFDSIFSVLLATTIQRLQKKDATYFSLEGSDITEEINNENNDLYHIVRLAHTIESQIKGYQYINGAVATTLSHTPFPVISSHEDIAHTGERKLFSMSDYKCFTHPLNVLFPEIGETAYVPIDYGVIYSGRPTLNEHTTPQNIHKECAKLMEESYNIFKNTLNQTSTKRKPKFYKELLGPYLKGEYHILQSVLGYMSFEILHNLKTLFHKGYSEEDIKTLLLSITKTRHAHNVIKKSSRYLSGLVTTLQQYFGYRGDLLGISYNDSNSMGGCLFFVTPLEGLRKNIINTLHQAQREFSGAELLYSSWLDGIESEGLLCEQDLLQQKASHYIDSNMLVLETEDKNMIFGSYNDLIKHQDIDIILDTVHMKIYTQGKKLTSKDLHSQTGTIEMLLSTLNHIGTDISNKQLPLSSYSKSKNDMVGKIVVPLIKFIKANLKKDLPIECYGGMYDYFLRLNKHNIKFGIMRKAVELE